MAKTIEERVAFIEAWLAIPAVHLDGYVAPEPEPTPESEDPSETPENQGSTEVQ